MRRKVNKWHEIAGDVFASVRAEGGSISEACWCALTVADSMERYERERIEAEREQDLSYRCLTCGDSEWETDPDGFAFCDHTRWLMCDSTPRVDQFWDVFAERYSEDNFERISRTTSLLFPVREYDPDRYM